MTVLTLAVILAALLTIASLVAGVSSMVHDGEIGHLSSAEWMVRRVGFQAAAFILILLSFFA